MERDGSEGRGRESRGRPGGNSYKNTLYLTFLKLVIAGGSRMKGKKNGGGGGGLVGGFWK